MTYKNENIWIIGASSGIGRELAVLLAALGATLVLFARRENELAKLQQELGEIHQICPVDVSDYELMKKAAEQIKPLPHRVIFMSAIYKPSSIVDMDLELASKMVDINLKGAFNLTKIILPIFEQQRSGQIAFCGSVAGYTGLPHGQPYGATKAALINFVESLYAESPDYIDVKLINPGFVSTPMTEQNDFTMPMITTPQKAAKAILKGLNRRAFEIHFPKNFTLLLKSLSTLPYPLKLFLTRRIKPR